MCKNGKLLAAKNFKLLCTGSDLVYLKEKIRPKNFQLFSIGSENKNEQLVLVMKLL
jgi:hypothetical protein